MLCIKIDKSAPKQVQIGLGFELSTLYISERPLLSYPYRLQTTLLKDDLEKLANLMPMDVEFAAIAGELARLAATGRAYLTSPFTVTKSGVQGVGFRKLRTERDRLKVGGDVEVHLNGIVSRNFCPACKKNREGYVCPDFVEGAVGCLQANLIREVRQDGKTTDDSSAGVESNATSGAAGVH